MDLWPTPRDESRCHPEPFAQYGRLSGELKARKDHLSSLKPQRLGFFAALRMPGFKRVARTWS